MATLIKQGFQNYLARMSKAMGKKGMNHGKKLTGNNNKSGSKKQSGKRK